MNKLGLVCFALFFMVGCSNNKNEQTKKTSSNLTTNSQTKESTSKESELEVTSISTTTSETAENSTIIEKNAATTPGVLRGTWVGDNGEQVIEFTITDNEIISNGQPYTITTYSQDGNTYTINWDINSVSNPGNPQPFIYTYSPDTDELTTGITFHRK